MMPMGGQPPVVNNRASAGIYGGSHINMPPKQLPTSNFPAYGPPGPGPAVQRPVGQLPAEPFQVQNVPVSNGVGPLMPVGQQNDKRVLQKEEKKSMSLIIPMSLLMLAILLGASAFLIKKFLRDD